MRQIHRLSSELISSVEGRSDSAAADVVVEVVVVGHLMLFGQPPNDNRGTCSTGSAACTVCTAATKCVCE